MTGAPAARGSGSRCTGTFLHPIVDHVLRARRNGITGTKALILYPMNALANDQAQRLAGMITGYPELGGITAALYTGQQAPPRTSVTADGLITVSTALVLTTPLTTTSFVAATLYEAEEAGVTPTI